MTEEIIIDECYFCDNGTCNIYPWTCDYDWSCKDNNECKVKKIFLELQRLKQENEKLKEKVKSRENELANMTEQANMRINNYRSALEEIRGLASPHCTQCSQIINIINEVLG